MPTDRSGRVLTDLDPIKGVRRITPDHPESRNSGHPGHPGAGGNAPANLSDGAEDSSTADRVVRWIRNATLTGLALSLLAHAILLFVAHFIQFSGGPAQAGGGREEAAAVQVAMITEAELATLLPDAYAVTTPQTPEAPEPTTPELELLDAPLAETLAPEAIDVGNVGGLLGAGDIGLDASIGAGDGSGSASFFGAEAQGSRFCYIVDVSGSMALAGKIEALKGELIRSIAALFENADFIVIPYSGGAAPMGGRAEWTQATDPGKASARRDVLALQTGGTTIPLPAFEIAYQLKPRPDAIYFMTDGEFDEAIAGEIIRLNTAEIPIHAITLINDDAAPYMRDIARRSGGTYHHVRGP